MRKVAALHMWVLFVGVAFISFSGFSCGVYGSALASGKITAEDDAMTSGQEKIPRSIYGGQIDGSDVSLEDYHPFDPSPSSKASIRPEPIQHGTPLNPYIPTPRPSPPRPSDDDDDADDDQPPQP